MESLLYELPRRKHVGSSLRFLFSRSYPNLESRLFSSATEPKLRKHVFRFQNHSCVSNPEFITELTLIFESELFGLEIGSELPKRAVDFKQTNEKKKHRQR